ncbi:hypothetical protein [Salinispira pacifica]|uniref:HEAT repeat domain-containing protein n=1 Tax=Salinispira pacifica TaxID=1307761 RepID=V5WG60_9SPIO|nr:hypothetical protein [Salinispira pacifica]AHC14524.1 hypothetical protein L21SP2_1121 [Salinispira pacifica]
MKTTARYSILLALIVFTAFAASAQDDNGSNENLPAEVRAFVEAFERVEDVGKLEVIQSTLDAEVSQLETFYSDVLDYVVNNEDSINSNTQLREMALLVFPRIIEGGFTGMNPQLWTLFDSVEETFWRIEVLNVMQEVGQGDRQLAVNLADWMADQNQSKRAGTRPDFQVVREAVETLGALGDPVVYPVLLDTVLNQYSAEISGIALRAISEYENREDLLVETVEDSQPPIKRELFTLYTNRDEFDDIILEVSHRVLSHILEARPNNMEARITLDSIRLDAVRILSESPREEFAPALIAHLDAAIRSYDRGTADKSLLLEAIGALGQTDSTDAAVRLAEYLDLINTYTELDRPFDRQITLAVINNLKTLGKPEAYNPLYMVTVLNYSNGVQDAAREALEAVSQ